MNLPSDRRLNAALAAEVSGLRGAIVTTAEAAVALPERFTVQPHATRPAIVITDQVTGRAAVVGLFAYREACQMLAALLTD